MQSKVLWAMVILLFCSYIFISDNLARQTSIIHNLKQEQLYMKHNIVEARFNIKRIDFMMKRLNLLSNLKEQESWE